MIPDPPHAISQRVSFLEKDVQEHKAVDHTTTLLASLKSEIQSAVNPYLRSGLGDALQKVLRKHDEELKQQYSQQVDYKNVIEESMQANIINEVKNLLPKFLPKTVSDFATLVIQSTVKKALEKTPTTLAQSSSKAQSSLKVAESLSEYELKMILFDNMDKSRSYLTHDKHQVLYDALFNSSCLDDVIAHCQADPEKILRKRDHDDDDKDEDPSAGPNQDKKTKRRRTKESESSKKSSATKETFKGNNPTKDSKSDKSMHAEESVVDPTKEVIIDTSNDDVVNDADQPQKDSVSKHEWFKQPSWTTTLDLKWNMHQVINDQPEQPWFNNMVFTANDPLTFDDLMATPINFSKFMINRLKIDKLTKAHLVSPVYILLKGTCQISIKLEYNIEECYKALTYQLDLKNPEGDRCPYDLSKSLPLKGHPASDPIKKYTTSITKIKAARYELVVIEDMIPNLLSVTKVGYNKDFERGIKHWGPMRQLFYRSQINKFCKHDVYSTQKILSVVSLKIKKLHGYGHLEEIVLFNLVGSDIVDLEVALRMFTRSLIIKRRVDDLQLGVETYQKKLKLTKPQQDFLGISAK
ncbi:hypothetical protein Tco_0692263 [Tanacetum coccineum]